MKESCKHFLGIAALLTLHLMLESLPPVWAETYEYDDLNRLTKIIYTNGDYIEYEYDLAGNILSVFSPDLPPVAVNDVANVAEDASVTAISVMANDTDSDGGPKSIDTVTQPPNGTVVITSDGVNLTYTPAANYCNDGTPTDDFTYALTPGGSTGTVRVTVTCVNDPPEAADDAFAVDEDTQLDIAAPGALGNDSDLDGHLLTATLINDVSKGTLIMNSDGSFHYTPNPDFNGADSFGYQVCDIEGACDAATVSITVNPVNDAPVAANDAYFTEEDTTLNVSASGVLGNDSDVDGEQLTASHASGPSNGTLALNSDGSFNYTPNLNFFGTDSFSYTVVDGNGAGDKAAVNITISPVNDAPVAVDDMYVTNEDNMLNVLAPGVLGNDSDVDVDKITAVLVSGPGNGILTLNSDGSFAYTPNPNYNGADSFTYTAGDSELSSGTATVRITANPVNDAPQVDPCIPVTQTVQYSDWIQPITIAASDIDSSLLTLLVEGLPDEMNFTGNCTPDNGGTSCQWTLDGQVQSGAGTYDVTVTVKDGELDHSEQASVIVDAEDASAVFSDDNPVAIQVASAGGNSGEFSLIVQVSESLPDLPDDRAGAGDISLAVVSMVLEPVGPGSPVEVVCGNGPVSGEGYDAVLTAKCTFNDIPVNTYTAVASIGGDYFAGSSEDVLTVYDPSLGFATGGGWLYWPGTADKTNFGFTMKYSKNTENVKGSLLLIRHLSDGTIYRVKSNALYGLALGEVPLDDAGTFGWASFSGKATYLEPGWPEAIGNHEFVVYIEDHNELGNGKDAVWVEVHGKDGIGIPVMSMGRPAGNNSEEIENGNIIVPHR